MKMKKYLVVFLGALTFTSVSNAQQTCRTDYIAETTPTSRFTINGDGAVTDNKTKLMWKQCSEGQIMDGAGGCMVEPVTDVIFTFNWRAALQRAEDVNNGAMGENLGYVDWRLPNIKELGSIVELACYSPAINLEIFPDIPDMPIGGYGFWSSSPEGEFYSWMMNFRNGSDDGYEYKSDVKYVRLVRGGLK